MSNSLTVRLNGDSSSLERAMNDAKKSIGELTKKAVTLDSIQERFDGIQKKSAMEAMATAGLDATDEGKQMWEQLSNTAKQYDEMLQRIQADTRNVGKESANVTPIKSNEGGLGNINFKGIGTDLLNKSGLGDISSTLGNIATAVNPVTLGLTAVGGTMIAAGKATAEFETHLNSLQALTNLTDGEMKAVNDGAIEMSKNFKSSASEIVDAMKLIGSQAPELLKDSDALMKVTEAANVLSEAAEIGVGDAAKAITGVMNQMGVSATKATDIINAFAAASQQGSADVTYLNKAFEKSGTAASSAGMDYVQLASVIETVAPKFSSADVAGSQLASTLLKLSMSGKNEFMPSVVGMTKALENLANAEMDDVEMKNLVGESNITMLKTLIDGRAQFDSYSESLRGTNTAYEQMAINQKGFAGAINSIKSAWDAFLLTLGQSGIMEDIVDNLVTIIGAINEIINVVTDVIKAFESFGDSSVESVNTLQIRLDFLISIIKGIGEVIQIVVRLTAKAFNTIADTFRSTANSINDKWQDVKNKLMDIGFVRAIVGAFNKVIDSAANMCNAIKKYWNKLKEFLGMKVETDIEEKATHTDVNVTENKTTNTETAAASADAKKSKGGKKTQQINYLVSIDDKTLDTAEKKLSAWQNKKKSIKIDDVEGLKKCDDEIKKWQEEVTKRKLIIEFGNAIFDNLNILQSRLSELEQQKREIIVSANTQELNAIESRLNALQSKEIELRTNGSSEELEAVRNEIDALTEQKNIIRLSVDTGSSELINLNKEIESIKNNILIESIKIGFKLEIEKGSLTDLQNELKKLEDVKKILFQTNADPSTIKRVNDEIKALKKNIESEEIRLGIKPTIEIGSLNEIKKRIKEKEDEINLALNTNISPEAMKKLQSELEALRKEEEQKGIEIGVKVNTPTIHKEDKKFERGSVDDKKQSLSNAKSMTEELKQDYKLGLIGKDEVESQLKEINSLLTELGLKPIELHFNDDGTLTDAKEDLERFKTQMDDTADIVGNMGNVFGSLGSAIGGATGEWMNFARQSLNAIAQVLPQIITLITAKQAEAMASGTASAASLPFPANIAAMASIIATVASLFASIPKFENGGIVGGSSFTGDKLLARVNSGEMILNKAQQKNLYDSMGNAQIGTPQSNTLRGEVDFKISGSSLKGCLKNYNSKMSKIR